ncbi:RICIN domain-containing protein [Streptosporangium amethystogenes]|uniref:RICIN domain-containing protein n=1 Tax=Streptosporangium amethystogenes TaxID=2002 RepID=UPI0037B2C9F9
MRNRYGKKVIMNHCDETGAVAVGADGRDGDLHEVFAVAEFRAAPDGGHRRTKPLGNRNRHQVAYLDVTRRGRKLMCAGKFFVAAAVGLVARSSISILSRRNHLHERPRRKDSGVSTLLRSFIRVLAALVVTIAGLALPTVAAQPAQAAASICSSRYGSTWNHQDKGHWWAAAAAGRAQGHRMVVDVQGPWTDDGVQSHIWDWYNGESQYWCLRKINFADGSYAYQMRNYRTGKCIGISESPGNGVLVKQYTCNSDGFRQRWVLEGAGSVSTPDGSQSGKAIRLDDSNYCLDVQDEGTAPGTRLQLWSCKYFGNQVFY